MHEGGGLLCTAVPRVESQGTQEDIYRSGHQRSREHEKEVGDGVLSHPLVQHFLEEHEGMHQDLLFRVVRKHRVALYRLVCGECVD